MPEKKWIKPWEREYNLLKMDGALQAVNTRYFFDLYGFRASQMYAIRLPSGNDAICAREKSYQRWVDATKEILLDAQQFKTYLRKYQALRHDVVAITRRVGQRAALAASPAELIPLLGEFAEIDSKNMVIGQWTSFLLTEHAVDVARALAEKHIAGHAEQERVVHAILSPERMSEIRKERKSLLRVALAASAKEKEQLLEKHVALFEWIACTNVIEPKPWTRAHFVAELARIPNKKAARAELRELENSFRQYDIAFKRVKRLFPKSTHALIGRLRRMVFIKDDRDDVRRKSYYHITPLYKKVAAAISCEAGDIVYYTSREILAALRAPALLPAREIAKRKKAYVLIFAGGKTRVATDKKTYRQYLAYIQTTVADFSQVQGIVAAKGVVRGKAKIAPNIYSLAKIQKGDILITITTHPDYLPAMRLAAAFVTDEGGLTSHAAIVAREMGKPCIVGTKHATKVFKDGDMVEVDADRGVVRKI